MNELEANPDAIAWLANPAATPNSATQQHAAARQTELTKPPGALGRMEEIAIQLAKLQGTEQPGAERVTITVFAGDHGVAEAGVSAFPQAVTAEMVKNFSRGGAAICVAARVINAELNVINLGTAVHLENLSGVTDFTLGKGTANFLSQPAMQLQQLYAALDIGRQAAESAAAQQCQLFIGGEMGIANTTAASAVACALLETAPAQLAGPGTGLDQQGVRRKAAVIGRALVHHQQHLKTPLEVLRRLGGFEIAALAGSYIRCAQLGLPVLIDGFISSIAALAAIRLCADAKHWFLYAHASAEPGHRLVLEALDAQPLLDLGMRLGEGSGAAIAVPLLRAACALHNEMATFAEAGVSEKSEPC